ncbi:MAG: hypothetical protein H6Q41_4799 [Deltaproteobacteria bacterium]|nr:hypothetical protein [Deltaproteobacteria bacterium]
MSKVKSHWPAGDVYLSSSAPASVDRAYHKIQGSVKRNTPTATSWGRGDGYGLAEKTICKAAYQFRGSLGLNDIRNVEISPSVAIGWIDRVGLWFMCCIISTVTVKG